MGVHVNKTWSDNKTGRIDDTGILGGNFWLYFDDFFLVDQNIQGFICM